MPRGDGTGPPGGGGPGTGRGRGMGGGGRGRMGGFGLGAGGNYVCPQCGKTAPHQRGMPCTSIKRPACGAPMTRQR